MKLRYNENGDFRIIQFTDLHLGVYPSNENDVKTYQGITKVINEYQPDLLVFTGDIIYSMNEHGATNPAESFSHFIDFINQFEIPSAITFGNHDAEEEISRTELREIYEKNALYQAEKHLVQFIEDRESYVLELLDANAEQTKQVFYVIDSGDYSQTDHSYYAWVLPEQVVWFKQASENYKRGDQVKNDLIFQHIPIPEYWLASQNIEEGHFNEDIAMNFAWSEDSNEKDITDFPFKNGVFSPEVNSGLFLQMLLNGETWGMFVGHDHDNSFNGVYKGIHLVYGQSSGYNSYGSEAKGARVIDLKETEQSVQTYPVFYDKI